MSLEGSTPSPSAERDVPVAERPRRRSSKPDRRVRLPPGTLPADNGRPDTLAVPARSGRHALKTTLVDFQPAAASFRRQRHHHLGHHEVRRRSGS